MASFNDRVFSANTQTPPVVTELEAIFAELPDEELLTKLRGPRRRGRPGYDPQILWRCYVAYYYLGLPSVSDLVRILQDNPYIAYTCGISSPNQIPSQPTFSRFGTKLSRQPYSLAVKNVMRGLVRRMYAELPGFGESLAIDSTDIKGWSNASKKGRSKQATSNKRRPLKPRKVSDPDCGWIVKKNTEGLKKYVWGYKVHFLCDTTWEVPLAAKTTPGNVHDLKAAPALLSEARVTNSKFNPEYVICDASYSDKTFRHLIRRQYGADPIIDPNPVHKKAVAETKKTAEWKMIYNRRSSVERLNGRLKAHRRLNSVRVRGKSKVRIHAMMSTIVCQAQALATESCIQVRKVA